MSYSPKKTPFQQGNQHPFSYLQNQNPLSQHKNHALGDRELLFDSEPIIGFRKWVVAPPRRGKLPAHRKIGLYSCTYPVRWPEFKPMRAHCVLRRGLPQHQKWCPDPGHTCGIYAYKELEPAQNWGVDSRIIQVVGSVKLWGSIVRHEKGYRAEFAYPLAFYVYHVPSEDPTAAEELLEILTERYLS